MTVKELIQGLEDLPSDAQVRHLWDGAARTAIECVYLARSGDVITAEYEELCYDDADRPIGAPTETEDRQWKTPGDPREMGGN